MENVPQEQENQSPNEEEEEETDSEFTCQICFEPVKSSTNKFKNSNLCYHPFCLDCISNYIEARVSDGAAAAINCPALNCNHSLDPLSCRVFVPKSLFNRWCDRLCESAVLEIDRCYCPYTNCSALVLNECGGGGTVGKSTCPNCKWPFCFECKVPWHAGFWCRESQNLRDQNDVLLGKLLEERKWMRCGKRGHAIEQNGGCSVITCRADVDPLFVGNVGVLIIL